MEKAGSNKGLKVRDNIWQVEEYESKICDSGARHIFVIWEYLNILVQIGDSVLDWALPMNNPCEQWGDKEVSQKVFLRRGMFKETWRPAQLYSWDVCGKFLFWKTWTWRNPHIDKAF
jgi:hypothetical protein